MRERAGRMRDGDSAGDRVTVVNELPQPGGGGDGQKRDIGMAIDFARAHIGDVGVLVTAAHLIGGFFLALFGKRKPLGVLVLAALAAGLTGCTMLASMSWPGQKPPVVSQPTPPAATPAPAPTPAPTPTPVVVVVTPPPTPGPIVCPPLALIRIEQFDNGALNVTPMTSHDFCTGHYKGRMLCPLGPEGSAEREVCEAQRMGAAGPSWLRECEGGDDVGCVVVQKNPYLAKPRLPGPFKACSRTEPLCGSWP